MTKPDIIQRALVLFAHGARDPNWAAPFQRLQQTIQDRLPDTVVSLAFLELMEPRLPALVRELVQRGCKEVVVVPIFLGQGGHVSRDLPLLIEQLQKDHPELKLKAAEAAGEDADVLNAIASYCMRALQH